MRSSAYRDRVNYNFLYNEFCCLLFFVPMVPILDLSRNKFNIFPTKNIASQVRLGNKEYSKSGFDAPEPSTLNFYLAFPYFGQFSEKLLSELLLL